MCVYPAATVVPSFVYMCNGMARGAGPLLNSSGHESSVDRLIPVHRIVGCRMPAEARRTVAAGADDRGARRRPASRRSPSAQHHHPIRTSNAEAQKMFDQGMAQAFGFHHEAAIRSFERAAELDPSAAMPHWGKAWALGPNYNLDIDEARAKAAYDSLVKAQSLAATGPRQREGVCRSA